MTLVVKGAEYELDAADLAACLRDVLQNRGVYPREVVWENIAEEVVAALVIVASRRRYEELISRVAPVL